MICDGFRFGPTGGLDALTQCLEFESGKWTVNGRMVTSVVKDMNGFLAVLVVGREGFSLDWRL